MRNEESGYQKLQIYERSYKAALGVYKMTEGFPKEERYSITDQMKRASLSVTLNIAEGYAKRESQAEFKRFLMMSVGSANEMSVLIDFAKDLGYIGEERYMKAAREYDEISRMLNSFIASVDKKSKI